MSAAAFDSLIHRGLFADDEVARQLDDHAQVRTMLRVEAALARAAAAAGLVPGEAAERIARAAETIDLEPGRLTDGTTASGVPVGALAAALREEVGDEDASWVHWGATSQDIVDTALVLRLAAVMELLDGRLAGLIRQLEDLARRHADTPILARTRTQAATPTSFGLKIAGWAAPLRRHRSRLAELRPRVLVIQLGGAAGTRSVFGEAAGSVAEALAAELGLGNPPLPWHNQRDNVVELAGWLSSVTGSLGKIGRDVALLAQGEVGELRVASGGGSSTMPQKSNPVGAEILESLARHNATLVSEMHHAQVHAQERDGAAWTAEWLALPQMAVAAGAALNRARSLTADLVVDTRRMADNLAATNGLALAEAATFALSRHMTRRKSEELVKLAAQRVREDGGHLLDHLAGLSDAPVDWAPLKIPGEQIETAKELLRVFLAAGCADDRT